jgi:predicted transcriptional regulator
MPALEVNGPISILGMAPRESGLRHDNLTGKTLRIDALDPSGQSGAILRALANDTRIAILRYLGNRIVPVNRIAADLSLPASTANLHITQLERAGLLQTELQPARRGLQKICVRRYDEIILTLPHDRPSAAPSVVVMMPIGAYSQFDVEPSCGLAGQDGLIGLLDDLQTFAEPERLVAQLLWFRSGFVEYSFPNRVPPRARLSALQLSAEVCSEAPLSDPDWPSDISVWINDVHLGVWTSPGDLGGQRGRLTPSWWEEKDTQYGQLKRWRVTSGGTTLDGVPLSQVGLVDLDLRSGRPLRVRIGVDPSAENVGGINLFGRGFGNYPQDIELRLEYEPVASSMDDK